MSDWGSVVFYYDYECEDRLSNTVKRVRGLVSKAYRSPGHIGMILHAYNGISYFLERCNDNRIDYGMDDIFGREDVSNWAALNMAFDVFFDHKSIVPGSDSVKYVIAQEDKYKYKEDIDELKQDLFNCEGTHGFLYITYTGDQRNGFSLKYAYNHTLSGNDEDASCLLDSVGAVRTLYEERELRDPKDPEWIKEIEEITDFFDTNAVLITSEKEFWGIEAEAAKYIKEIMTEE